MPDEERKKDLFCSNRQNTSNSCNNNEIITPFNDNLCSEKGFEIPTAQSTCKIEENSEDISVLIASRWDFLNWESNNEGISQIYNDAVENASRYLKENLGSSVLKEKKLSLANLIDLNLGDFVSAITRRKIKWNDIKKFLDIKIYKWDFLRWSKNSQHRSYSEAVRNGATFFLENIYTQDFLNFFKISYNVAPKLENIRSYGFSSFVDGLIHHNVLYSDIIEYLGFKFIQKSKWNLFSWSQDGFPRSYSDAVSNATIFFKNSIYSDIKNLLCLESNIAPSLNELRDNGYESFVDAIYDRNIKYSQIVEKSDLKFRPSLWSSFNWENSSNTKEEAFDNIVSYYRENINTEKFRINYNIKKGFAPSLSMIKEYYSNDFYSAITNRGFKYSDIVSHLNLRHTHITETPYKWGELSFLFKENRLINNKFIGKEIIRYFKSFKEINFPFNIFNKSELRASNFQLQGDNDNWVNYKDILKYFKNYISISNNQYDIQLRNYTNQYFKFFENDNNRLPTHNDILPDIFERFDFIVALETPTFKYVSKINKFYTGHIDLLGINNHIITIYDLKRDFSQVLKALPQFFFYYFLLNHNLKIINPNLNYEIRCVGLTPSEVFEIQSSSLKNSILDFIKANSNIKGRLTSISFYKAFDELFLN